MDKLTMVAVVHNSQVLAGWKVKGARAGIALGLLSCVSGFDWTVERQDWAIVWLP